MFGAGVLSSEFIKDYLEEIMSRYLLLGVVLIVFGFTLGVSEFSHAQTIDCSTYQRPSDAPDLDDLIDELEETGECIGCNLICADLNDENLRKANLISANLSSSDPLR